jgi:hypothetical protein
MFLLDDGDQSYGRIFWGPRIGQQFPPGLWQSGLILGLTAQYVVTPVC